MLKLTGATKVYQSGDVETAALRNVSLSINEGEFVSVVGPSGCGKSTLLNILGTLDSLTAGDYEIAGERVARTSEAALAAIRRRHIGFVFQNYNLIDQLTVRENIELALRYRGARGNDLRKRVNAALERLKIEHRADHRPSQLSGGQQQRVAIARAIVTNPSVILADEPTGNLDAHHGQDVMGSLVRLNQEGSTIVMVTHSAEHAGRAQRTVELLDGEIISHATSA